MTGLNSFNLKGKTALITGGAGLLGMEHAAALLESGAQVVITDINAQALQTAHDKLAADWGDERVFVEEMDVTSPESIKNTMTKLEGSLGGIHILINNAAIDPKVKSGEGLKEASRFEHFSLEQWNQYRLVQACAGGQWSGAAGLLYIP